VLELDEKFFLFEGKEIVILVQLLLEELLFLLKLVPLLFNLQFLSLSVPYSDLTFGNLIAEILDESEVAKDGLLLLAVDLEFPLEAFFELREMGKERLFVVFELLPIDLKCFLEVMVASAKFGEVPGEGGDFLPDSI